jgi:uncharacterized protein (TIGR02145 family)
MIKKTKWCALFLLLILIGCGKETLYTETGTFTDSRDNRVYKFVKIGSQVWMAENLAYLPVVSPSSDGSETSPYYYVYGYEGTNVETAKAEANYTTYGVLYNWVAAKTACPTGWHLPSQAEWSILPDFLGSFAGGKMKESGTSHWFSPNTEATNSSGFNALPGGYRYDGGFQIGGGFYELGEHTSFLSATGNDENGPWVLSLVHDVGTVGRGEMFSFWGLSVRCIKN